jgi:heptaprenyl diphosphate synthase
MKRMTPSASEPELRRDARLAAFAALAVCIHLLEAALPMPVPGLKPGLANVVTLVVLLRWGLADAVAVQLLRVLVASLAGGSFLSPGFVLALAGAIASLGMLALVHLLFGRRAGPVGHAAPAALAHMSAQLAVAALWFLPPAGVLRLAPLLLTAALGFGILSGMLAHAVLARLPPRPPEARP